MSAMRRRQVVRSLCLALAASIAAAPLAACDPAWLTGIRPDGVSVFVALALAETVVDTVMGQIAARTHPGFGGRLDDLSARSPGGQRVRLLQWNEGAAAVAGEAILVPWSYREDCRPIGWTGPLDWIPAGRRGAFTGWLRPREHWLGGRPTFDVEMAWREPMWAQDEPRWFARAGQRRMTPEEFAAVYSALPTEGQLEHRPREEAARIRQWERGHPALAALAPATTLLARVYRIAGEREGRGLAGRWAAEVRVLEARELPLPVKARTIRGELLLEPVGSAPGKPAAEPAAVYTGRSTVSFAPLGFLLTSDEVMVAVEEGRIRMILDPTVDHGHVVAILTGGDDELVGTWSLNSRPARASGSITLRRRPT